MFRSLRYDQTVRADYEHGLALAKERLGPVLPEAPTQAPDGDWRKVPLIKSRLVGGYCLRTAAQGVCAYTNIFEHCPNFRSEPALLAVLSAQRADAQQLAQDPQRRLDQRSHPPHRARRPLDKPRRPGRTPRER